jgi:hypothetical protein
VRRGVCSVSRSDCAVSRGDVQCAQGGAWRAKQHTMRDTFISYLGEALCMPCRACDALASHRIAAQRRPISSSHFLVAFPPAFPLVMQQAEVDMSTRHSVFRCQLWPQSSVDGQGASDKGHETRMNG